MIITRSHYEALLDTISKLENDIKIRDQYIENLRKDVKAITRDRDIMFNIIKGNDPYNIDYPNKDKGVQFR